MPQLLALEWNDTEARLAVANGRGSSATIEQAFSVSLRPRQPGEDGADVDVGTRIAAALAARGITRIDALIAVGRSNIELRQLSLPPAPDEELPDMVRFQAVREFNELDENWLLDFVPIDDQPEGGRTVLAAAIGPQLVEQIQHTCQTAGVRPRRLVLRPCAAASLLVRSRVGAPAQLRLLVDLLSDEADLTVMIQRRVIFLRTTRLGGDPLASADQAQALLGEIRRTMAAAQNQLGGQRVESIVLCGRGEQHACLAKLLEKELDTPTELFDPFGGLSLGAELERGLPDHPGRFAPLLGMLLAEIEQTGHVIDFLHPRRPPAPPSKRNRYILGGVAAAVVVLSFLLYNYLMRWSLQSQIDVLKARATQLEPLVKPADQVRRAVAGLDKWSATDFVWLDELLRLGQQFPPANEAMLKELTIELGTDNGRITVEGVASSSTVLSSMEKTLGVVSDSTGHLQNPAHYKWQFRSTLPVAPRKK